MGSREVYRRHYGPIPEGWHVHHIDGNRKNNDPKNLIALSPEEHYHVHLERGDPVNRKYFQGAAKSGSKSWVNTNLDEARLEARKNKLPFRRPGAAAKAAIASVAIQKETRGTVGNGGFGRNNTSPAEAGRKGGTKSGPKVAALYFTTEWQAKAGKGGTKKLLAEGRHSSQIGTAGFQQPGLAAKAGKLQTQVVHTCSHCGKTGKSNAMFAWHFDRCKSALD